MSTAFPDRIEGEPSAAPAAASVPGTTYLSGWLSRPRFGLVGKRLFVAILLAAAGVLVVTAFGAMMGGYGGEDQLLVYHTVVRTDLPITVTERGNLASQKEVEIVCELENLGYERSGSSGTQILSIVPNGKSVKQGELLVELDAAPLEERLDNQVLATEKARAEHIQAKAKYENQMTQNVTSLAEAKLQAELAELELKMFQDGEDGTYQLQLQTIDLTIQEAKNKIVEAEAGLLMQTTDVQGVEMLYKLGYKSKGDLDQAQVNYLKSQGVLVRATNELANAKSNRTKTERYDYPKQKLELEGTLETAKRAVIQVERNNESMLAQAKAAYDGAERGLEKEEEKLGKYRAQLGKCKIYAPQDGMVAYAIEHSSWRRGGTAIGEGASIRERQKILTLPSLTKMQVKMAVHESVLDQVRKGLPATIRIDAFPDRSYKGTVQSVAVMPDEGGWMSSGTQVYETIVTIDEEVARLKPGMTAVVEIHVDHLENVVTVPVQAIVQRRTENWCYVGASNNIERRTVTLGRTNDKFVEIRAGISAGEQVVLNPMAIMDEQEVEAKRSPEEDDADADGPATDDSEAGIAESRGPEAETAIAADGEATPRASAAGAAEPSVTSAAAERQDMPASGADPENSGRTPRRGSGPGDAGGGRRSRGAAPNLLQYDTNGDGRISRDEVPERIRSLFSRIDRDGNGYIDSGEIPSTGERPRGNREARP